ncbi:MAG: zinc metalloprotease HtpX [candidate division Zixibacteria bacterium]|nr:zinc metalloprotease HtpX [candidate division Zixibacteria bacterium]
MNTLKTTFLLTLLTLLLVFVGQMLGGNSGMVVALIFAAIMNLTTYWFSDKIVLAMYRAKPIEESDNPGLYNLIRRTATKAGLPMPKVYVIPTQTPNAFATGRNPKHAAVAVTSGILKILNEDELEGVISHEMAHVKNRDILTGSIVATLAGAISMLAFMARWAAIFGGFGGRDSEGRGGGLGLLIMAIVAPLAALLIQMAISRSREYAADQTGAKISHKPLSLANALRKLEYAGRRIPLKANPSTAHLFIVNPLSGKGMASLFSTHPPVEERVARLEKMAHHEGSPRVAKRI